MSDREAQDQFSISRRKFVQGAAFAGFAAFLAACTGTRSSPAASASEAAAASAPGSAAPSAAESAAASVAPSYTPTPQNITGPLKWAQWPGYIDQVTPADAKTGVLPAGSSKTLVDFEKKYNVKVDYIETIEDNNVFVDSIRPA